MDTVENSLLGFLILQPQLLKTGGLSASDFTGKAKTIFIGIADIFEETEGADITLLQNKLDGKIRADEIADLVTGIQKTTPENFTNLVRELKKKNLSKRIISETNRMAKAGHYKIEKAEKFLREIVNLRNGHKPNCIAFSDIEAAPLRWLYFNKIPAVGLSLLVGDPGAGKGIVTMDLMARISTGRAWPYVDEHILSDYKDVKIAGPGSCVLVSAEDNPSDTLRPRLQDAGGNLDKVFFLKPSEFTIQAIIRDLKALRKSKTDLTLAVIDPLDDYLGNVRGNDNIQVRAALGPLLNFSQETNMTILGIQHLNKDQAKRAVYRTLGSMAYIAVARSVFLVQPDEEDQSKTRRYFAPLKANLAKNPTTLAFNVEGPIGHPVVKWESEPVEITPDAILADAETKDRMTALDEAIEFLREILKNGRVHSEEIKKEAEKTGISQKTLRRAKKRLKIKSEKDGSKWFWSISK
jgi:RecA-family ATPase